MKKREQAERYRNQFAVAKKARPMFHVTPAVGWINDPNGFSEYRGEYHLFYQYHPYSTKWGPMHWGHCVSKDLVMWEDLPVVMAPDRAYDEAGCFSGTAISTEEGHVLFYTGVQEGFDKDGEKWTKQNQCMALGDGASYEKYAGNPVITGDMLPKEFSRVDFRDPKIWKEEDGYYLIAGNRKESGMGHVVLFRSENLRDWKYVGVLAEADGNLGTMWECPDFFALGEKHLLIISPQYMKAEGYEFHNGNNSVYLCGDFHRAEGRFVKESARSLDYGLDFYAPQTMETSDGRRILIAWMKSWDAEITPEEQKWCGMMTLPRELTLRDGVLFQKPVREWENYLAEPFVYEDIEIEEKQSLEGIQGRVLQLEVEVKNKDFYEFGIEFAANERYHSALTYYPRKELLELDRTWSGMTHDLVSLRKFLIHRPKDTLKLRMILDKNSAEVFVNDGEEVASMSFYTPMEAEEIRFFCDGKAVVDVKKRNLKKER